MTHWAARYVGTPWDAAENHCWAFCRRIWREVFGVEVPEALVDGGSPLAARRAFGQGHEGWQPVDTPQEGDAVLMAKGRHPCHVGVWAAGGVLHSVAGLGGIHTPPARLQGYRITGYYRRAA